MKKIVSILMFFALICPLSVASGKTITLTTSELQPYIGQTLENNGYVYELISEVFQRLGYDVEINFFPWARSIKVAQEGFADGIMPIYYDEKLTEQFVFSDPFPGGNIGLLKRKDLPVSYRADPAKDPIKALGGLQDYVFGIVRGSVHIPEFDQAKFLKKEVVHDDLLNLKKLFGKRVDFIVIDKYTAADIMVKRLPHMIGHLEFMEPALATRNFHVAFSKKVPGYQQRVEDFNRMLQQVVNDTTLDKILASHGLLNKPTSTDKTVIKIGTIDFEYMTLMQRLSKEFERDHSDIKLEWQFLDEDILRLRTKSDLAISDGKFDVMTIGTYEAPLWGKSGWLTPIESLPESYDLNDVFQPVQDSLSYAGRLYALPFYAESSMTFYNRTLFQKAGVTMPKAPTYNNIKELAAAIHDPEQDIYGICLRGKKGWGSNMAYFNTLVYTFGGRWFDEHWNTTIDTPEWRKALTLYYELMTRYGPPNGHLNDQYDLLELFDNGQCGMWIDATVFAGILSNPKTSKVAEQVAFAPALVAITVKGSHWMWIWALGIPASSKVPEQAKEFIMWATSKEYIKLVAKEEGWVAVPPGTRSSTYKNPEYLAVSPFADAVHTAIQTADVVDMSLKPVPYTGIVSVSIPEYSAIGSRVGQILAEVIEGEISIEQALKKAQVLVQKQMKDSGYSK